MREFLPNPHSAGRPKGSWAHETYSARGLIDRVPRIRARDFASGRPAASEPRLCHLDGGTQALVERTHRGCVWHCPLCPRRSRSLYDAGERGWACRVCSRLDYPSQRLSRGLRRRASELRRELGPRTLATSLEAILNAKIEHATAQADRRGMSSVR